MPITGGTRWVLRIGSAVTLAFLYAPLVVLAIYAFSETRIQTWPPEGFTCRVVRRRPSTTRACATRCG